MKRILNTVFLLVCISSLALSQKSSVFENSGLGMAFTASSQWIQVSNENCEILELVNPNNNLKVKMWSEITELNASDYLNKLLLKEGLAALDAPFKVVVDNREAEAVVGLCNEMHRPVRVLLLAIHHDDGFYVVRFKCPEECYREHQSHMEQLISSVKLIKKPESHLYYAVHRSRS